MVEEKEISVTTTLDVKEHFRFNKYILRRTTIKGVRLYMLFFIISLSSMFLLTQEWEDNKTVGIISILEIMKPIILIVFVYLAIKAVFNLLIYFQSKKAIATDKVLQKEQNYRFSDENINIVISTGEINLKWENIWSIEETKYAFYVFLSKKAAYVIPKSFLTVDKMCSMKNMFRTKMNKKKLKLKRK